jgi:hypothetical protein
MEGVMKKPLVYKSIRTTKAWDGLVNALYLRVRPSVEEIELPPLQVISVTVVPPFVSAMLVGRGAPAGKARRPDVLYEKTSFETVTEGRSLQMLHVGPYDKEQPAIDELHRYMADHGLVMKGGHHEIYISDPRRTKPEKLKTVIRFAVEAEAGRARQ